MDQKTKRRTHQANYTLSMCEKTFYIQITFYIQVTVGQFWQAGHLMMTQCGRNMS
jgi:hypothetical protein